MRQDENTSGMSPEETRLEMRSRFDAVNEVALNKRRVSRGEITAEELADSQSAALAAAADPWALQGSAVHSDESDKAGAPAHDGGSGAPEKSAE